MSTIGSLQQPPAAPFERDLQEWPAAGSSNPNKINNLNNIQRTGPSCRCAPHRS